MHEMSLVDALFDQIDAALQPYPQAQVREVRVRIGALAGVEPALFRTAFEDLRHQRRQPGADLQLQWEEAEWRCPLCRTEVASGERLACPACQAPAQIERGDGIYLDHLELEVPDV